MNLQLSLKKQWFEMTDALIKKEDYRDINEYWYSRLVDRKNMRSIKKFQLAFMVKMISDGLELSNDQKEGINDLFKGCFKPRKNIKIRA